MDRIDLHLDVPSVDYELLADSRRGESSKTIRERVMNARKKQEARFEGLPTHTNSGMSQQELETHSSQRTLLRYYGHLKSMPRL